MLFDQRGVPFAVRADSPMLQASPDPLDGTWPYTIAANVAEGLAIDSGGGALSGIASAVRGLFRPSVTEVALAAKGGTAGKPTIELFGGKSAQTPGAINVDIRADIQTGIRADARQLPFTGGSLGKILASNPYIPKNAVGTNSMMDFLPEATRVIEPGGKIFINANSANPYGKIQAWLT